MLELAPICVYTYSDPSCRIIISTHENILQQTFSNANYGNQLDMYTHKGLSSTFILSEDAVVLF